MRIAVCSRAWVLGGVMLSGAALGACASGGQAKDVRGAKEPLPVPAGSPAPVPVPTHAAAPGDAAPPEWWHEGTQTADGVVSVCSQGESKELRTARQLAMDSAMRVFREVYGTRTDTPSVKADSVRLADGTYRAFVKVSATR